MRTTELVANGQFIDLGLDERISTRIEREAARLARGLRLAEAPLVVEGSKIRAQGIAGTFPLGPIAIDIIPPHLADSRQWRTDFVQELARVKGLDWKPWFETADGSETLADHFAHEVLEGIGRGKQFGFPRSYVERCVETLDIRGQVVASDAWKRGIDRSSGYSCRYSEFAEDHPIVRMLRWSAFRLADMVSLRWLGSQLREAAEPLASGYEPDPVAAPLELEFQYGHLIDAVHIGNLMSSLRHDFGMVWSLDELQGVRSSRARVAAVG